MSADPPPKTLRNIPWKCSRTVLNVCSKRTLLSVLISSIICSSCCLLVVRSVTCVVRNCSRCFEFFQLADGVEVDVAEAADLVAKFFDLRGDGVPIHVGRLITGGASDAMLRRGAKNSAYLRADRAAILRCVRVTSVSSRTRSSPSCSCNWCSDCSISACCVAELLRPAGRQRAALLRQAPSPRPSSAAICSASDFCCSSQRLARRSAAVSSSAVDRLAPGGQRLGRLIRPARSAAASSAFWAVSRCTACWAEAAFPAPARAARGRR